MGRIIFLPVETTVSRAILGDCLRMILQYRIRVSFTKNKVSPATFFVSAAIENNMAKEIFKQLEKGTLTNAGNLTENEQVTSVCDWLIKL